MHAVNVFFPPLAWFTPSMQQNCCLNRSSKTPKHNFEHHWSENHPNVAWKWHGKFKFVLMKNDSDNPFHHVLLSVKSIHTHSHLQNPVNWSLRSNPAPLNLFSFCATLQSLWLNKCSCSFIHQCFPCTAKSSSMFYSSLVRTAITSDLLDFPFTAFSAHHAQFRKPLL